MLKRNVYGLGPRPQCDGDIPMNARVLIRSPLHFPEYSRIFDPGNT